MKNPWTKKNPFMSMWLSAANTIAGAAHGHAKAEARRLVTRGLSDWSAFYTGTGKRRGTRRKKSR